MVVVLILVFPESSGNSNPLPNSEKPSPAGPTNSACWSMPREAQAFILPLWDVETLPSNYIRMESKCSVGTVLAFSSLLSVTQWPGVLPGAAFFKLTGQWPGSSLPPRSCI